MLKKIRPRTRARGGVFAIVAAKYNSRYTDALVRSARAELRAGGAASIEVVRVPGSFEVPVVARELALRSEPAFDAILCFGAILRGATTHAQHIAEAVSHALADLQVHYGVPIVHGVLLFENETQAEERCFGSRHNRGIEAARVALEMKKVMEKARESSRLNPKSGSNRRERPSEQIRQGTRRAHE
jgi:6,7-dimethyl-8-ribityllumazine synthase